MGSARVSARLPWAAALAAVVLLAAACALETPRETQPWTDLLAEVQTGRVARVEVRGLELTVFRHDRTAFLVTVPNVLTDVPADVRQAARDVGVAPPEIVVYLAPD